MNDNIRKNVTRDRSFIERQLWIERAEERLRQARLLRRAEAVMETVVLVLMAGLLAFCTYHIAQL